MDTASIAYRHAAIAADLTGTSQPVQLGRPESSTRAFISAYRKYVARPFVYEYMASVSMSSERLDARSTPNKKDYTFADVALFNCSEAARYGRCWRCSNGLFPPNSISCFQLSSVRLYVAMSTPPTLFSDRDVACLENPTTPTPSLPRRPTRSGDGHRPPS